MTSSTQSPGSYGCVDMAKSTDSLQKRRISCSRTSGILTRVIQRHITFTREYQEVGVHMPQWQTINDLISKAQQNFTNYGLTFRAEFKKTEIYADPLLEKVFYNLVDNAIRYGQKITTISIDTVIAEKGFCDCLCRTTVLACPKRTNSEIFKRGVGKNTGMGLFLTAEILAITGITIEENGIYLQRCPVHDPYSGRDMEASPGPEKRQDIIRRCTLEYYKET